MNIPGRTILEKTPIPCGRYYVNDTKTHPISKPSTPFFLSGHSEQESEYGWTAEKK
jgi:hypothetical protein